MAVLSEVISYLQTRLPNADIKTFEVPNWIGPIVRVVVGSSEGHYYPYAIMIRLATPLAFEVLNSVELGAAVLQEVYKGFKTYDEVFEWV